MLPALTAAFVVVLGLISPFSQEVKPTDTFEGKVVAVKDGVLSLLNIKDGENKDFTIDGGTVITRNGKPAQLKEIQIDDKAEIMAVTVGEKLIAKTVRALAPE